MKQSRSNEIKTLIQVCCLIGQGVSSNNETGQFRSQDRWPLFGNLFRQRKIVYYTFRVDEKKYNILSLF